MSAISNDDLNDMTLLQLLQSFPDPPVSVYIDPSLYSSKPVVRSSVIISAPTVVPNGLPLTLTYSTPLIPTAQLYSPQSYTYHNNHSSSTPNLPILPTSPPLAGGGSNFIPAVPSTATQPNPLIAQSNAPSTPSMQSTPSSPAFFSTQTTPPSSHRNRVTPTPYSQSAPTSPMQPIGYNGPNAAPLTLSGGSPTSSNGNSPVLSHPNSTGTPLRASAPAFLNLSPADTIDLVSRGCKGELQGQEWQKMNDMLLELTPENLASTLEKCYDNQKNASSKSKLKNVMKKSDDQFLKVSKHLLDFNYGDGKLCPLDAELTDEIILTNIGGGKAKFKVSPIPPATTHILTITPKDGILKKKQSITIQFKLRFRTTTKLRKVITIETESGCKYFVVISIDSEKSVFGVSVEELEYVDDNGMRVPIVLAVLRNYFYTHSGLRQEGVFRVQGDEKELQRVKNQLNKGTFTECTDVNCIASLIKLWFRELPQPILQIPIESLRTLEGEAECVAVYNDLPEPNRTLMTWLMDVLADASMEEATNKMNPRNFSICVAPNLFISTGTNPADALFISSKVVHFVLQIITYRLRLKYPR